MQTRLRTVHAQNYSAFVACKMHVMLNRLLIAERYGHVAHCTVERLMPPGAAGYPEDQDASHDAFRTTRAVSCSLRRPPLLGLPSQGAAGCRHHVCAHVIRVYVAFVTDVNSRLIVGWQTFTSLYTNLALDALNMGI